MALSTYDLFVRCHPAVGTAAAVTVLLNVLAHPAAIERSVPLLLVKLNPRAPDSAFKFTPSSFTPTLKLYPLVLVHVRNLIL